MSEHFTHTAMYEDIFKILMASENICDAFKICLTNQYDSGLLGSGSRGNHIFAMRILIDYKEKWNDVKDDPDVQTKIAYAIGWITHRASDHQIKPLLRALEKENDPRFNSYLNSVYFDAMSFRKVYDGGKRPSASKNQFLSPATFDYNMKSHEGAKGVDVKIAEPVLSWMWQKDILSSYAVTSKESNLSKWLDTVCNVFPKFSENFSDYEEAYQNPTDERKSKYYDSINYYDENDELIRFVRGNIQKINLDEALSKAKTQSQYAQGISRGYDYVLAASDFFDGKRSKDEAYDVLRMEAKRRY